MARFSLGALAPCSCVIWRTTSVSPSDLTFDGWSAESKNAPSTLPSESLCLVRLLFPNDSKLKS